MISVCMATYNGAKYIKEQVDSILMQLTPNDELIVSDDGSTDATLEILKSYNDSRIKIFHHEKIKQKYTFGYTTCNFENALRQAKGECIFLSDQDDVWLPGKVGLIVAELRTSALVLSDCSYVDSNLNVIIKSKFEFESVRLGVFRNILKCGFLGSSMALRREVLQYALPIPENVPHDLWLGITAYKAGSVIMLNQPTMLYRRHDSNVSATNNSLLKEQSQNDTAAKLAPNTNSLFFKFKYRFVVLVNYIKFLIVSNR